MFDKFTVFSLIRWEKLDGEMFKKSAKKQITAEEYDEYLINRRIVIKLMNRGDSELTKDELDKLDNFLFNVYNWALA